MSNNKGISSDVGYLAAAFMAPRTLQKSMMKRDSIDQGIVTGLTMALSHSIAALLQDGVEVATEKANQQTESTDSHKVGLLSSVIAIGVGLAVQSAFQQQEEESTKRDTVRAAGYWLSITGAAGALLHGLNIALDTENEDHQKRDTVSSSALFIMPIGVLVALLFDFAKYKKIIRFKDTQIVDSPVKVIAAGSLIIATLTGLSRLESYMADGIQTGVDKYAKPLSKGWLPMGHALSLAGLVLAGSTGLSLLYKKMESSQDVLEKGFTDQPKVSFVSGDKNSPVKWQELSVQGRRHIVTRMPAKKINTDLSITTAKEPIRLYVGVDSATTEEDRVKLALAEIERTNALERDYLMLIAPTGSGYVNYVMSDALEYLSKGNCSQITLQYSKRPSPLSLDKVDDGFIQFRMLVNAVAKRVRALPKDKRPKVLLFGESLGAWVSQDAFLHSGTDGLIATGIDYALWIGTPELSKWQTHAESKDKLNMDNHLVGTFNGIKSYNKMPEPDRKRLRYVMVTHYNDPISHFSASLLIKSPKWLKRGVKRPGTLPADAHYRTPTTFFQSVIDMKNALEPKPGIFTSHGHDYRADILDFMNGVFQFNNSLQDLQLLNKNLTRNDKDRDNL